MVLLCPFPLDRWLFVATGNESRFFVLDDLRQSLKVRLRGSRKLQIFAVSTMPASEAFDAARCLPERRPIFESLGRHWVGSRAKKRRSLRRCARDSTRSPNGCGPEVLEVHPWSSHRLATWPSLARLCSRSRKLPRRRPSRRYFSEI